MAFITPAVPFASRDATVTHLVQLPKATPAPARRAEERQTCVCSASSSSDKRRAFVAAVAAVLVGAGIVPDAPWAPQPAFAVQESGRKKEVTRGLDLQGENFDNQDYSGKNFQTSLLRGASFKNAKLRGTNFFDADLLGADFTGADMTEAILELSNAREADFTNAVLVNAFVSSNTKWDGATITGADFSGVILRKDAQKYLCSIANGTNATTGVETRESLGCQ
eukprot:tig00020961_g16679.t1